MLVDDRMILGLNPWAKPMKFLLSTLLFLATAGLFGHADGSEWGVSHYRMKAV